MITGAAVVAVLGCQRLGELFLSRRNLRLALARGGREFHPRSFREIAALHTCFLLALLVESGAKPVPLDEVNTVLLVLLLLLQGLRYWCIATLGTSWNTRIVVVPGSSAVRSGPYRFLRHPNYLVVALEFFLIPLFLDATATLVLFCPLSLLVLSRRIRLEEEALAACTDYRLKPVAARG